MEHCIVSLLGKLRGREKNRKLQKRPYIFQQLMGVKTVAFEFLLTTRVSVRSVLVAAMPRQVHLWFRSNFWLVLAWSCFWACSDYCLASDELLYTHELVAAADDTEFLVQIEAGAPGTSWEESGRECGVLKVVIEARYDQHVLLFGGEHVTSYAFLAGPLPRGRHTLQILWDKTWTRDLQERPAVLSLRAAALDRKNEAQEPLLRAPILYLRNNTIGRFSDVPLILYWERQHSPSPRLAYTVIFSNEDGGTDTERLMARWGRTTDIEWCYSYTQDENNPIEQYQGRNHETLPFRGRKEGWHPILYDVTTNNNFSDSLSDPIDFRMRPAPVEARLEGRSRESVMDQFPWTYAIMAEEMIREEKLEYPADPGSPNVSDLRNYAYLDVCSEQRGTELYFAVLLKGNERWFRSDHGDPGSGIERSGCVRSTVELPPGTRPHDIRTLRIHCRPAPVPEGKMPVPSPAAEIRSVLRLFLLEKDYRPGQNLLERVVGRRLRPGQSLALSPDSIPR